MASLGKLWFELGLKDRTDKDIEEIRKGVEKRLKSLNVDIGLNSTALRNSIENALRGQQFKIDVVVDKANTTKLIQDAIAKAGINTNVTASDVRARRIEEINNRINNSNEKQRLQIQKLQEQLRKLRGEYTSTSSAGKRYGDSLGGITKNMRTQFNLAVQLRNQLANIYSVYAAERFLTSIIEIGGEFQKQRVALQTMFQDAAKADVLFGQIKELAVESPFEFKELAGYTKQLAAFNIPYEEMYDTTKRLADISAGVGVDMGRIILAYGQVRSAEFLKGTELRQFTEAGIPLLQQLADKFTELEGRVVSVGEVFDRISKREVSFQMVKDVLWDLTNEGGQFYNMQGALADTLAGKLSNLRDAYDVMLADIAESNDSLLGGGLDMLTNLMKKWDEYSKVILVAVGTLGTYRVALLLATAAQNLFGKSLVITKLMNFLKATQMLTRATQAQIIASKGLSVVLNGIKANPIVAIASAIATVVGSFLLLNERAKSTDEVITGLNESFGRLQTGMESIANNDKLIDEYEQLSQKQNKTAKETKRLESLTKQLSNTFKGAEASVDEYGLAISMSVEKMRNLSKDQKKAVMETMNLSLKETKDELSKIQKEIEVNQKALQKTENNSSLRDDLQAEYILKYENRIRELRIKEIELQSAIADTTLKIEDFNKAISDKKDPLTGWRKSINDFIAGNDNLKNLVPKEAEEYQDWLKRLKEDLSEAKDELARKEGTQGLFPQSDIDAAKKRVQELQAIVDKFNISIESDSKKTEKDPIAERFQKQLDLMKEAMSTYNKYESMLGKEGAIKAVNKDSRLAGLNFNPDTFRQNLEQMQEELQKVMGDNAARIKVNESIGKAIVNIDLNEVKRNTEKALDVMRRTIEENTARWDLYKDLFNITGNRDMSMRFAFGIDASSMDGIYSQVDYLKRELLNITGKTFDELKNLTDGELQSLLGSTDEEVKSLLEQIRNTTKQESDAIIKNVVQLIQKYASEADKIKTLEAQRDKSLNDLRGSSFYAALSEEDRESAEDAILKEYANQISEIREESAKLLPIWQDLFGDTTDMGYRSLRKLVEEAKAFANTAKEVQNPETGKTEYHLTGTDAEGNIKEVVLSLEEYMRLLNQIRDVEKDMEKDNPFETLIKSINDFRNAKDGSKEKERALKQIGISAHEAAEMVAEITDAWSGMFDALGNEGAADALSFAGDMLSEIGSLAEGLTSGNPIQMATSALTFIPNIISSIANFHDKKLDRAIQKSALEVQKLQNAYTNLQTVIERQLGNITEKQTDALIQNLEQQRYEIEKQMQAEDDKKKTDASKIEDYKQQIAELDDQIKYFYEDLANELYSIDLKDWASQFADSLVDAWRNGEDAAEAFEKTASDVLANVANDMIRLAYIEPALEELRNMLPSMMEDGVLDNSEIGFIADKLLNIESAYAESLAVLDSIDKEIQDRTNGELSLKDTSSTSSTTTGNAGIQASEETMQLTNSYLNAIRQDVSVIRNIIESTGTAHLPTISITAQAQLQQLNMIAENTRRNADAAAAIQSFLQNDFAGVITTTSGGKALRVK